MRKGSQILGLSLVALCVQATAALGQTDASPAQKVTPPRPSMTHQPSRVPVDPPGMPNRPSLLDGSAEDVVSVYERTLQLARCIQHSHPQRLAALLEKPVSSRAEALASDRLLRFSGSCPGGQLQVSARMLRGAAAEVIVENFAVPAPDRVKHLNSAEVSDFTSNLPPVDRIRDRTSEDVQKFVACQVLLAPGLAQKLISAPPGSAEAREATKALAEATSVCGTSRTWRGPAQIAYRSYLAESFYHWARLSASDRLS